eukprot:54470-Eustigmatos_ZCMA.PRE.1
MASTTGPADARLSGKRVSSAVQCIAAGTQSARWGQSISSKVWCGHWLCVSVNTVLGACDGFVSSRASSWG